MKKTALLLVAAFAFAACGDKSKEVEVGTLASTLETLNGQNVTFSGRAVVKEAGKFAVYGADSTTVVFVTADESLMSEVECGKGVEVTGVVTACTHEPGKYYVTATSIKKACCKKDGKCPKKCCKKDSTACKKDTTACKKDTAPKKCHGETPATAQ